MQLANNIVTQHIVRRIFLSDELQAIKEMQLGAKEFVDHYPHHREWLEMALKEVLLGYRVAFGVFKYGLNKQKEHTFELAGSIILKKNPYSRIIQLKNLFIKEKERGKGFGTALYEEAENFSNRTGFELISTEVPFSEISTINFLHKRGYIVVSNIESRFKEGDLIYTMERSLTPCYDGDPFDIKDIGHWIMSIFYKLTIFEVTRNISFYTLPADSKLTKKNYLEAFNIKGAAFFLEENDTASLNSLIEEAKKNRYLMVFCRYTSEELHSICKKDLIPLIDSTSIRDQFTPNSALPLFPFPFEDIAGMIVSIKSSLFNRVNEKNYDSFMYFKGGPTGKYLKQGDTIALYSECTEEDPNEGLRGIATIADIICASPENAWKFARAKNKLFSKNEFDRFATTKEFIIAIELVSFQEIENISLNTINNYIFDGKEITWEIGHTYLNHIMVKKLFKRRKVVMSNSATYPYHVALSFAGEDRDTAKELASALKNENVTVFYDEDEIDNLWGKDLYQYFQEIFRDKANFCIPIISINYERKLWTSHELKQMQARAFNERREYILPLRLDDTEIPGINETTGFIDLRSESTANVAKLVVKKLKSFGFIS